MIGGGWDIPLLPDQVQRHGQLLSALTHLRLTAGKRSSKHISRYFVVQPQDVERWLLVEIDTNINISLFNQHSVSSLLSCSRWLFAVLLFVLPQLGIVSSPSPPFKQAMARYLFDWDWCASCSDSITSLRNTSFSTVPPSSVLDTLMLEIDWSDSTR